MVGTETAQQKAETGMQTVSLAVILYNLEQVRLGSGPSPVVLQLSRHGVYQPNAFIKQLRQDFQMTACQESTYRCPFYRFYVAFGTFGFSNFKGFLSTYVFLH